MEDKKLILAFMKLALKNTREYSDLDDLVLSDDEKEVTALFSSGYGGYMTRVNVAMDSGSAMIRDVIRGLEHL